MSDTPPRPLFPDGPGIPRESNTPQILPSEFIQTDVVCAACRYNLRGQPRDGRCPECGAPVMEAFRIGQLTFCDANWLRRVRSGVVIGFWTFVASIVLSCIMTSFVSAFILTPNMPPMPSPQQQSALQFVNLIVMVPMVILGMIVLYRFTTPEPRLNETGPIVRKGAARAAVILAWIIIGFFVCNAIVGQIWRNDDPSVLMQSTAWVVYVASSSVANIALGFSVFVMTAIHLRSIARRDAAPGLGRLFTVLIWGSGVNVLTLSAGMVMSFFVVQSFGAMMAASTQANSQATTQIFQHGPGGQPIMVHYHNTYSSSMPTMMFAPKGGRIGHMGPLFPSTNHMVVAPIAALGGCFGLIWFILFVTAAIQFYRALSRAITHNVGMADAFAVQPLPPPDTNPIG